MAQFILGIDDESELLTFERTILESAGYKFDSANGGQEGLDKLSRNKYDLVLLNLMMPKMNGFEVCKVIKSKPSLNVPVIFISSSNRPEYISKALALGAEDYIVSPYDPDYLLEIIHRVFSKSQLSKRKQHS
jgi:DNA-binding response OmpR family regulator